MHEAVAHFLLKIPPIDEIGGSITHVIEQYRANVINLEKATETILKYHKSTLDKYINMSYKLERDSNS